MPEAIVNTSPLVYLYRIGGWNGCTGFSARFGCRQRLFRNWKRGSGKGTRFRAFPSTRGCEFVEPRVAVSEWLAADLGPGEVSVIALGLENPGRIVLLDDARARRIATAAGLTVWGTLRVLLEAKSSGLVDRVALAVERLREGGMWISESVRQRILAPAGEFLDEEGTP